MKRILLFIMIISIFLTTAGCDKQIRTRNFTTDYGDELIITAKKHVTLQDNCVDYEIIGSNLKGGFLYYDTSTFILPENPEEEVVNILNLNNIHLYGFREYIFYVFEKRIDSLPKEYDVNAYLTNRDFETPETKERFLTVLHTLMQSKRIKYMKQFASILLYENDANTISILQNWSKGIFTDDEIQINTKDGYSTFDLQEWAIDLLQSTN